MRDVRHHDAQSDGREHGGKPVSKGDAVSRGNPPGGQRVTQVSIPDILLLVAAVALVSSIIATTVARYAFGGPPERAIVFHQFTLAENEVKADQELRLSFTYDKRPECFGRDAEGEYYFRVWYSDGEASSLRKLPDGRAASADPPGKNQTASLTVRLSHILPPLEPGQYELQVVGSFRCHGETHQFDPSPRVPFTVTS
ncbi:hypothetical protein HYPDE_29228 [Hyphomicrobium denitrificans 1NES1]|uniref:Uncharacterized protein n=1 Tax=Hyphomicrobium denitrificans 1NES1 TaxID=670307 RepID=N0BAI7_9HYPH|nr:hypothetical protein [Hyphomicrobium denitrificans]AGK57521.1 hypothetical protein HYPDE_29228 [Hyphomicrobium denitrificans 1NES1]